LGSSLFLSRTRVAAQTLISLPKYFVSCKNYAPHKTENNDQLSTGEQRVPEFTQQYFAYIQVKFSCQTLNLPVLL